MFLTLCSTYNELVAASFVSEISKFKIIGGKMINKDFKVLQM